MELDDCQWVHCFLLPDAQSDYQQQSQEFHREEEEETFLQELGPLKRDVEEDVCIQELGLLKEDEEQDSELRLQDLIPAEENTKETVQVEPDTLKDNQLEVCGSSTVPAVSLDRLKSLLASQLKACLSRSQIAASVTTPVVPKENGDQGTLKCDHCSRHFTKEALASHLHSEICQTSYQCPQCCRKFSTKAQFTLHICIPADGSPSKASAQDKGVHCTICGIQCSSNRSLVSHLMKHQDEPTSPPECEEKCKISSVDPLRGNISDKFRGLQSVEKVELPRAEIELESSELSGSAHVVKPRTKQKSSKLQSRGKTEQTLSLQAPKTLSKRTVSAREEPTSASSILSKRRGRRSSLEPPTSRMKELTSSTQKTEVIPSEPASVSKGRKSSLVAPKGRPAARKTNEIPSKEHTSPHDTKVSLTARSSSLSSSRRGTSARSQNTEETSSVGPKSSKRRKSSLQLLRARKSARLDSTSSTLNTEESFRRKVPKKTSPSRDGPAPRTSRLQSDSDDSFLVGVKTPDTLLQSKESQCKVDDSAKPWRFEFKPSKQGKINSPTKALSSGKAPIPQPKRDPLKMESQEPVLSSKHSQGRNMSSSQEKDPTKGTKVINGCVKRRHRCDECGTCFKSIPGLKLHSKKHKSTARSLVGTHSLKCEVGKVIVGSSGALKMDTSHKFACKTCKNKQFQSEVQLRSHMRTAHSRQTRSGSRGRRK